MSNSKNFSSPITCLKFWSFVSSFFLDWLRAVRAFMVMGIIANFVAMIVAFMGLLKEDICFRIVAYTLLVNGKQRRNLISP